MLSAGCLAVCSVLIGCILGGGEETALFADVIVISCKHFNQTMTLFYIINFFIFDFTFFRGYMKDPIPAKKYQ